MHLEWSDSATSGFYPLYAVWNNGLRVTATGGEDSISSLHRSKLLGSYRTYVYTGNLGLNMDAWFTGLKRGRAFVSSGPSVGDAGGYVSTWRYCSITPGGGEVTIYRSICVLLLSWKRLRWFAMGS